ncbi:YjgF-like protein [Trichoderma novae-zelandiae]
MAASKSPMPLLTAFRCLRQAPPRLSRTQCLVRSSRSYSADADAPPPLLQKLKGELKAAMRAKDAPRLSVLRSIMSANLNASKTPSPIRTDVQLVALIRKLQKSAQDAVADAQAAGRDDLVQKESQQISILDEYIAGSGVQTLGEAEIKALINEAVEAAKGAGAAGKSLMGDVMKRVNGALEGKDVDRKSVAALLISSGSRFEEEIAYSRAVIVDDWVLVSGTTGYNYETGKISDDVVEQTEQTMVNIDKALREAESSISEVVRVRYILPERDDFPLVWPVLRKWLGNVRPAATMVQAALMLDEMKIEIEVTAKKGSIIDVSGNQGPSKE